MNRLIGRLRYWLINKPKHRKRKPEAPRAPYMGPEQWLLLSSNHKWRERYGNRT